MGFNVAMLEAMQAEGLDLDACIRVLKAGEKKADPTNAERQARHRAKRKEAKDNARYSNGVTPPNDNISNPPCSEPNGSSQPWACPEGVDPQVWEDFLKNRKRKRLPNTATAWKLFLGDLDRVSAETGIPPPRLIELCTGKGWGAIYDPTGRSAANDQRQQQGLGKSAAAFAALDPRADRPM